MKSATTLCLALACLIALPATAQPQSSDSRIPARGSRIQWWHVAIVAGTIGAVSAFDRGVDVWVQDHRSTGSNDFARAFRHGGQPEVVFGVPAGMLATGLIAHNKRLERSAARVLASVVAAGVATVAIKELVGRVRPIDATNQYLFRPFTHNDAFPSGHTTVAFAFAASLGEEIHRPWARVLLYAGAAGTGWSRLNDHEHWLTDVLAGAAVGVTAANVIERRWRVFGLRPPRLLVGPNGARMEWRTAF
jgi:membrane-associated phospholipid phosphatase